ncbi:MAG: ketopantoate reductase [Moraxellaceae bacterium]|jgi:2-dehydropantoate 2-reductase|nr:ketopantoate reductase [Moraxellaceae bacterium]
MKILVVGAGAVGQVYAKHLAMAHAVTFFVKPAHADSLAAGLALHRLNYLQHNSVLWKDYRVVTTVAEIAAQAWDQVWLCMSADALQSPLSREVLAAVGRATVVCLQPGPDSAALVRAALPDPAQLVQGLITFIAYQSPLPGRPGPAGMAYFHSRLAPGLFSGAPDRVDAVVQALRTGGMAARRVASLDEAAGGEGLLQPLVAALEVNGWRLHGFARTPAFRLGRAAALETLAILAADRGAKVLPMRLALLPLASRVLFFLAPKVLPLALEPYLEFHFSKVGVQTRQMLEGYIALGERHGLPVGRLRELRSALP